MTPSNVEVCDWTEGQPGIQYQICQRCAHVWYFQRGFCPGCGSENVRIAQADGRGTVHAITSVERAPSAHWQAQAPYTILLVDLDEGLRVMAHGAPGLGIGDRVSVQFRAFGGALVPHFDPLE